LRCSATSLTRRRMIESTWPGSGHAQSLLIDIGVDIDQTPKHPGRVRARKHCPAGGWAPRGSNPQPTD
jgi:hypothetical protein